MVNKYMTNLHIFILYNAKYEIKNCINRLVKCSSAISKITIISDNYLNLDKISCNLVNNTLNKNSIYTSQCEYIYITENSHIFNQTISFDTIIKNINTKPINCIRFNLKKNSKNSCDNKFKHKFFNKEVFKFSDNQIYIKTGCLTDNNILLKNKFYKDIKSKVTSIFTFYWEYYPGN